LGVDDSKQLSSGERAALAKRIREAGWSFAFGEATPKEIDCWNVLEATRLAARRALEKLHPKPDFLLTDALALPGTGIPFLPVLRADTWSYSVACASILAKVERDQRMVQVGREYPQYGFEVHKGYGVPEHRAALARFGPCPEHRLSFQPVLPRLQGKRVA
jgi:ribonuclease HII